MAFISNTNRDLAIAALHQAREISPAPAALFQREKYLRSVAVFASRDAATAALPAFRQKWHDAYIVDFRSWCPAAVNATVSSGDPPTDIDCRF